MTNSRVIIMGGGLAGMAYLAEKGYVSRAGHEYPADDLRVVRVWTMTNETESLRESDLRDNPIQLPPR